MNKGQITVPDLIGVFILLFIFMVFLEPITTFLAGIFPTMSLLGKIPLSLFIPLFLIAILSAIWYFEEIHK